MDGWMKDLRILVAVGSNLGGMLLDGGYPRPRIYYTMAWTLRASWGPWRRRPLHAVQTSGLATGSGDDAGGYAPRKRLIWEQCQRYLKHQSFVLLQLDNLGTKDRLHLKDQLRSMGLALKTPKTHILRRAMRTLGYGSLQEGVVGFIGMAVSHRPLPELQAAILHIRNQSRAMLLGGRFASYTFTHSGMIDLATNCPTAEQLRRDLLAGLIRPGVSVAALLTQAQQTLCTLLGQRAAGAGAP